MVKFNTLLTLLCASTLCTVVTEAKTNDYDYQGECLDIYNALGEDYDIASCIINENGQAISLDVIRSGNDLTQNVIDVISSYSNLQELELTRFGAITDINFESIKIPKVTFYDLKKILHSKQSKFRNNVFTPEVLQTLKNVDSIELDGYQITQATLDSLSTLSNVKEIFITDGGFDENLDFSVLKSVKNLATLVIDQYAKAQLLEGFPESICQIKQLKRLDMFIKLTSLPSCIGDLRKLEYLDLYENELIALPDEIGQLSKLKYLDLHYNNIENFSNALCKLYSIETLDIGENYNSAFKIPSCIQNLSKLKFLDLSDSAIEAIPSSFYNLKKLEELNLEGNKIPKLSSNIKNLKNLKSLRLGNNEIAIIPDNIGKLVNLEYLDLGLNKISVIPDTIRKLVNLKTLHLGSNQISEIPEVIRKLVNLESLDLHSNTITKIPEVIGKLTNLKYIELGYNKISVIPEVIGKLVNLEELILSDNMLTDLPEFIGNLTNLVKLDLSFNYIDATIPECYNNLEALKEIDLGGNEDIRGKALTNPNLSTCDYNVKSNKSENGICYDENATCYPYFDGIQACVN